MVLKGCTHTDAAIQRLEHMRQALAEPAVLDDIPLRLTCSAGLTFYPADLADADGLLRHADLALYAAKDQGKDRIAVFDVQQGQRVQARRHTAKLVEEALGRGARRIYAATRDAPLPASDRVTPLTLDLTEPGEIERAARQVEALDLLVNNAGIGLFDDLSDVEVVDRHLRVNLLGLLRVTRAFLPLLRRSRGAVINNLSLAAVAALPVMPGYSISKAAASSSLKSAQTAAPRTREDGSANSRSASAASAASPELPMA